MPIEGILFLGMMITLNLFSGDITFYAAFLGLFLLGGSIGLMFRYLLMKKNRSTLLVFLLVLIIAGCLFVWWQTDYTVVVKDRLSASILFPLVSIGAFASCIWFAHKRAENVRRVWLSWAGLGTGSLILTYSILIVWTIGN